MYQKPPEANNSITPKCTGIYGFLFQEQIPVHLSDNINISEDTEMTKNSSIKCDVTSCKYNLENEHYCSLESIKIGTHEANPTVPECTDCMSFVCKCGCQ